MGDEKVVLMGRKTFESLSESKLPGRTVFVLTRQQHFNQSNCIPVNSIDEMFRQLSHRCTEVYVAGGGDVYEQMVDFADRAIVTRVEMYPTGGVKFPSLKDHGMRLDHTKEHPFDMTTGLRFGFEYWVRL
jgi:dihydrofolate reductase